MQFPYSHISNSEEETKQIAYEFADFITEGMIIILNGDLGAGKTLFIQSVLKKFQIGEANSPTFSIVNEYSGIKKFFHFDFYRINKKNELYDIGIEDYFNDSQSIIFIEWGNLFEDILPKKRIEINILYDDFDTRTFNFLKYE
ncbi:MAG: tRNA (adenosine(37)-N6)-threonylcarbamoyltransferase complex ATPase subunit type 1 TsaE [Ignavibacteriaceae bacterium]